MATPFEDLRVLRAAEAVADDVWRRVVRWDEFARDVVGRQLARAADSIGANIAEAYGRFHYGDKVQFLYYARGSLFETKYWLNRTLARGLMPPSEVQDYASRLTDLARQLNAFADSVKSQRRHDRQQPQGLREASVEYATISDEIAEELFSPADLAWLQSLPTEAKLADL